MVIEESKRFGKMLGALNAKFIDLIPNKNNMITFKKFRSVSLCNLLYKIVWKIIENRLKQAPSQVISDG